MYDKQQYDKQVKNVLLIVKFIKYKLNNTYCLLGKAID